MNKVSVGVKATWTKLSTWAVLGPPPFAASNDIQYVVSRMILTKEQLIEYMFQVILIVHRILTSFPSTKCCTSMEPYYSLWGWRAAVGLCEYLEHGRDHPWTPAGLLGAPKALPFRVRSLLSFNATAVPAAHDLTTSPTAHYIDLVVMPCLLLTT